MPEKIDAETGYRYYTEQSYFRANTIKHLKDFGFTLKEIKNILNECKSESDLRNFIEKKIFEVESKSRELTILKKRLKNFPGLLNKQQRVSYAIREVETKPIMAAGIQIKGKYQEMEHAFQKLYKAVGHQIKGKPFCLYYDMEYKEQDAQLKPAVFITKIVQIQGIECFRLAAKRAVCLLHKGPYGSEGQTFTKLFEYCHAKKYKIQLPIMERFIRGPGLVFKGNPEHYLTEIVLFV